MWGRITSVLGQMGLKSVQNVQMAIKPHVPLIKFPLRGTQPKVQEGTGAATDSLNELLKTANPTKPTSTSGPKVPSGSSIESSDLPKKYRRKPLTKEEMEVIEKGGQV